MVEKNWSVGEDATGVELGRFATEEEAAEFISTLDPASAYEGCYWLTNLRDPEAETDAYGFSADQHLDGTESDAAAYRANSWMF